MNGIESILKKIIAEAEHKAAEIEAAAESQLADIKRKADEDIAALRSDINAFAENQGKLREEQLLRAARREAKNKITAAKRGIIDGCFDKALQNLANLSSNEYEKIVESILSKIDASADAVVEQIGKNAGFIVRQGKITVNYSFADIAREIRPRLEAEISRILWQVDV